MASAKSSKKTKHQPKKRQWPSLSSALALALMLSIFGHFGYTLIKGAKRQQMLSATLATTYAVVVSKKNFFGNSPVSHQFSYSYSFRVNGKTYIGDTKAPAYKVGDTLKIRYVTSRPEYNEAAQ